MAIRIDRIVTRSGDDGRTTLPGSGRVPKTDPRIQAAGALDELNSVLGYVLAVHQFPPAVRDMLLQVQSWLFDAGAMLASAPPACHAATSAPPTTDVAGAADAGRPVRDEPAPRSDSTSQAAASPASGSPHENIWRERTSALEHAIAAGLERLSPLNGFVIPGGRPEAAALHWVRAVARRTEIALWAAAERARIPASLLTWANRLSDALFVWGRLCNDEGRRDVLWEPHGQADGSRTADA